MSTIMPARVGIVGCGEVAGLYYLSGLRRWPVIELAACADLDADRASALSADAGCPAVSVDYLLSDPSIEVVLNLTPPDAHAAVTRAAIAAGKHVYTEKPLATSREDGRLILAEAAARGVRIAAAPDTFLGGGLQTARKLIDDGWIGEPVACSGAFAYPVALHGPTVSPMFDMGPYYVTALTALLGPVARVSGVGVVVDASRRVHATSGDPGRAPTAVMSTIQGLLEFASGVIGHVSVSYDLAGTREPHLEVHGTKGSFVLGFPNDFDGEILFRPVAGGDWREVPLLYPGDVERGIGLADLIYAIRDDREPRASGERGCHALDVMLAIGEAAERQACISLTTTMQRPDPLPLGLRTGQLDAR